MEGAIGGIQAARRGERHRRASAAFIGTAFDFQDSSLARVITMGTEAFPSHSYRSRPRLVRIRHHETSPPSRVAAAG
jgi:hypothetical protein